MRTTRIPLPRLAIAAALALSCAAGLSSNAHADPGRGWDRHGDRGHARPHFNPHPRYHNAPQAWNQPRYYRRHPHVAPSFGATIVFRSAPVFATPVLPAPRIIIIPTPLYGVRELGPAW